MDAARRSIHHVMPRVTSFSLPLASLRLLSFSLLFLFLSLFHPVCLPASSLSHTLLVLSFSVSIIVRLCRVLLRFSTGRSRFHARSPRYLAIPLLHPLSPRPQPPSSPSLVSFVSLGSSLCPVFSILHLPPSPPPLSPALSFVPSLESARLSLALFSF